MTIARTVGRNTLSAAVLRFAVLCVWFVVTPRVLAVLGPERFGYWSILLAFGGSLAALDLGLGVAVTRSVAGLHGEGGRGAVLSLLRRASAVQALAALLLGGAALLARPALLSLFRIPEPWRDEASRALMFAVGAFVLTSLANLFVAGLQGLQRMDRVVPAAVLAALALGAAIVWGVRQPQPLVVLTAVQLAYAAVTATGYGIVLLTAVRQEVSAAPTDRRVGLPELLRLGGWVQVNAVLGLLQAQVDKFLLGALVALAPVAAYELGARITQAAMIPPILFFASLLPAFTRAATDPSGRALGALYVATLDPAFGITIGITGGVIALAPWILAAWLGAPPAGATACLVALMIAQAGYASTGVVSTVVRARGDLRLEFVYAVLATALHVALAIVGLRFGGLPGLLAGTAVSSVLSAIWYVRRVDDSLEAGARGRLGRHLRPFLAAATAGGAVAYAVASAMRPAPADRGAILALAVGGAAYLLTFAATLRFGFGETWTTLVARGRRLHPAA